MLFRSTPSGNALYLTPHFRKILEEDHNEYQIFIDELVTKLEDFKDKENNAVFSETVINWERYYSKPCADTSPDLIITLRDGGFISVLKSSEEISPRILPEGTHRPDGIFIGKGPSFKSGEEIKGGLPITCVTPLMLALADLEIPSDLSSVVPLIVLNEGAIKIKKVIINENIDTSVNNISVDMSQEHMDKDILMEQLKTLGYID